ncbi:DUF1990 family protein [Phytoactinopolyspora mesophila]|uniref:DUF1990 family protein n=1 Tax=Phytoactinopolyspora mesophila TaxID=2650750 RepID=UPI001C9E3A14
MTREFTYPEVGSTDDDTLPGGYHHVRLRERIGHGRPAFHAAADGAMTWGVHRGSGLSVDATADRAASGVEVICGVGVGPVRLRFPCRVVWTVEEDNRIGFAYGTLPGHPESGEESFIVEIDDAEAVWFTVTAFSRPAQWYTKLAGPLNRAVQLAAIRRYIKAARRLVFRA